MDKYRMAKRVLWPKSVEAGKWETEVRLDGWCEGGLMPGTHYVNAHLCMSLRLSIKENGHSANPDTL